VISVDISVLVRGLEDGPSAESRTQQLKLATFDERLLKAADTEAP
jgi:hypothetical protein